MYSRVGKSSCFGLTWDGERQRSSQEDGDVNGVNHQKNPAQSGAAGTELSSDEERPGPLSSISPL